MTTPATSAAATNNRFPGGGGSRRDIAARDRVLAATAELLAEVGYADLTIEGVAARAGVGKPTIYRWWSNKAHLAYEASCATATRIAAADTGDLESDLRSFVQRVARFLWRDEVSAALRGMLTDPAVVKAMEAEQGRPAREHVRTIIAAGIARGTVRPDVDADAVYDLAVGAIVHRALLSARRRPARRVWIDSIVDLLLHAVSS
jgi:AcrR family transcriptional regulator